MAYTITAQVYQTNPNAFFRVVEKTVFNNGTWDEVKGAHILTMGGSGTSGSLRFVADTGENFIVTLGVHNYKPWGDIVTKLDNALTGVKINPEYYEKEWGGSQNADRVAVRWKNFSSYEVSRDGRKYSFNYGVTSGNELKVNLVIG
jgi:hypothetical protein